MEDRAKVIFGNKIRKKYYKSAQKAQKKYISTFGDDSDADYKATIMDNSHIGELLGVKNILIGEWTKNDHYNSKMKTTYEFDHNKGLIVGNIHMGSKSYRISMAMASAAKAMGYIPYWMDLNSYNQTTATKIIGAQKELFSLGQKMSRNKLFGRKIWEPMNYEGFRALSYNALSQKHTELMAPIYRNIPKDIPFIGTHVWTSQAAVHAGMKYVVNAIPDNWPMAVHLSEGSLHTVQCHSGYMGYRILNGMNKDCVCAPMPNQSLVYTGHYIDHELVSNIESDCAARIARKTGRQPMRFLLTLSGSGVQREIYEEIIYELLPLIQKGKAVLYVNAGENRSSWKYLMENMLKLKELAIEHFDQWKETIAFCSQALNSSAYIKGIHVFWHKNIFETVYCTNMLMRSCDVLITEPGELAFYPVPKLLIKSAEKYQTWNAIHSAEAGDGTLECQDFEHALQMVELFIKDESLLKDMCQNIMKNKQMGLYDGAYRVVELAIGLKNRA